MFEYTSVNASRLSADASSLRSLIILILLSTFCNTIPVDTAAGYEAVLNEIDY